VASNKYQESRKGRLDLVDRSWRFARDVRHFLNGIPRTLGNWEDARQLVRSSGSVAANYLEAQEGLSRKDFFFRIKVCRKEARESGLWLRLLDLNPKREMSPRRDELVMEADELKRIFQAIAAKDDTGRE
jgi:four helix bundle protein